ncbi:hypothetical protein CL617_04440 [archaeon]|nr:hypothetical protein [archaeon]|tara:strand:+ start:20122 stop:21111 length:990 start_codon:yes stop_codon:yes gene_type:complete
MNAFGVSGSEEEVRDIIKKEVKKYISDIKVDKLGNLIVHKKGDQPRIMVAAHMDEIGLIIKSIDHKGRIRFSSLGGIEPLTLLGQRVHIFTKRDFINGFISLDEISNDSILHKLPDMQDLFIDTGLNKKELTELGVEIGSSLATGQRRNFNLGKKDIIAGKALDDRIGCFILIELIKKAYRFKNEIYFVFTVQEEIGLYGAKTSAYQIDPEYALVAETTSSDDMKFEPSIEIGKGPCLTIKNAESVTDKKINKWIKETAKKKDIPLQYDINDIGTTDAMTISISKGGVPSSVASVPVRNIHSAMGISHKDDIENAIILFEELLKNPIKY